MAEYEPPHRTMEMDPEYLAAKLDTIHQAVTTLKEEVDLLKEESIKRAAYLRIMGWITGAALALSTFISNYLDIFKNLPK
jgi:hypothetical protein